MGTCSDCPKRFAAFETLELRARRKGQDVLSDVSLRLVCACQQLVCATPAVRVGRHIYKYIQNCHGAAAEMYDLTGRMACKVVQGVFSLRTSDYAFQRYLNLGEALSPGLIGSNAEILI